MLRAKKHKVTTIIFVATCLFIFSCVNVKGMEFPEGYEKYSTGLNFSETSNVIELHKGETYKNFFTVTNTSDNPITFKTEIMPYTTIDNEGGVSLQLNTSETEITKWTQVFWNKEITLEPGEQRNISYVIDVPKDCKLGEQKEAIMLNALTPNKYGVINSNGYLIYANIVDSYSPFPIISAICLSALLLIGVCTTIIILIKKRKKKSTKKRQI